MEDQTTKAQDDAATAEPDYKAMWEQAKAEADKWKAMSRKNEGRAKENAEAADQLADLSQRLAAIEGENAALKASAERAALVTKVAGATGVPETLVASLAATDEDGLTKAASAIAEAYKAPGGAPTVPEAGKFPHEGAAGDSDMREFVRQLTGRQQ